MAKVRYHLAPHGPDICRADPSNPRSKGCPFGGVSGSENHFDTMAEAESAYERQMEADGNGIVATAAVAQPRIKALEDELKERFRESFDSLVADSSYGVSLDPKHGFIADSSEGLERLRSAFVARTSDEIEPEVIYADNSDGEVIQSVYISRLGIEIENQNADEDMRDLQELRQMRADDAREYWR